MRVALLRAGRRGPTRELTSAAETLANTRLLLADTSSYEEILGHEGSATREYFRAWREVIGPELISPFRYRAASAFISRCSEAAGAALSAVRPGDKVTGQHLRLFLAHLAERNPLSWRPDLFYQGPEPAPRDAITWPGLVASLRRLGDDACPYGDYFPVMIAEMLHAPVSVLQEDGQLGLGNDGPHSDQAGHTIVLVAEQYLATRLADWA